MSFRDRREAGRRLAARLTQYRDAAPVILALPRGGVPVAYEIARALSAPLDLLIVRKLGAPGQPELGIGAVVHAGMPTTVLNDELIRDLAVAPAYLQQEADRQFAEIARRERVYRGQQPPRALAGRTVILVDDGIATGGTMLAAIRGVRAAEPSQVIVATPVAPPDVIDRLRPEVDDIVCLLTSEPFGSVGRFYADFRQLTDREVTQLLAPAQDSHTDCAAAPVELPRSTDTTVAAWCLAIFSFVWALLALSPRYRADWLLENIPTLVLIPLAVATYSRFRFSDSTYVLATLFATLHTIGAHYTYSHVPVGDWAQDAFGLERNHYDRFVHFSFGLLMLPALRELAFRDHPPAGRIAFAYLSLSAVAFWSVSYEILEWIVASLADPQAGTAYLGTQGDPWDAQKDVTMAALGAIVALTSGGAFAMMRSAPRARGIVSVGSLGLNTEPSSPVARR